MKQVFALFTVVALFSLSVNHSDALAQPPDDRVFDGYTQYVDPDGGNQRHNMHACPDGFAMGGDHLHDNRIQCRRIPTLGKLDEPYVENGNQEEGMLACKDGYYAIGLHGENTLLCQRSSDIRLGQHWTDSGTQEDNMHVCAQHPGGPIQVMIGMHEGRNLRRCAPIIGWKLPS